MNIILNLITYNNGYGLTRDVQLFAKLINKYLPKGVTADIKFSDFYDYHIRGADANIFLEIPSNLLIPYSPINILIPNQEWYYKTWIPYVGQLDQIWTKSNYASDIFRSLVACQPSSEKKALIHYLGWESSDYSDNGGLSDSWVDVEQSDTDTSSPEDEVWLHVCGKSIYKQTQVIIDSWKPSYPKLEIIYSPKDVKKLVVREMDNICYFTERLSQEDLIEKMRTRTVHLCPSEAEGFGHYLHEAMSVGALVISTDGPPMNQWISDNVNGILIKGSKKPVPEKLGSRYIISVEDMRHSIERVQSLSKIDRLRLKRQCRKDYLTNLEGFHSRLEELLSKLVLQIKDNKKNDPLFPIQKYLNPKPTQDLPPISLLTLVHNRKSFFPLAIKNFISFHYPPELIEWVIIDDSRSSECVKELVPNDGRIKYFYLDTPINLGSKRNMSVRKASNDILLIMDDDDYYPPESIARRVNYHLQSQKECVCSTILGCFEINKYISMINVPPHQLAFEDRISEASLLFTRSFWERQPFREDSRGSEAKEFLAGRLSECLEVTWTGILVALLHSRNTSTKIVRSDKPNGCHYGWSDELFLFITSLDS